MAIYINGKKIVNMQYGNIPIARAYYGNKLVFNKSNSRRVLDVENFNYTSDVNDNVVLTGYIGNNTIVDVKDIEEI